MVYLELFHGRETVDEEMDDLGSQGPVIGPLPFLHTTYGDWSVISEDFVQATPSLLSRVEAFNDGKATLQLAKAA